jgi:hypothetical protein
MTWLKVHWIKSKLSNKIKTTVCNMLYYQARGSWIVLTWSRSRVSSQSLDLDSLKRTSVEKILTCWENLNSSKSKPKILINLNFRQGLYWDLNLDKNKTNICWDIYTVRPVLTATSEQRPPVYSGQLEHKFSKILFL